MNNMNKELAVILSAIRNNAISLGVCLRLNSSLNIGSCYGIECPNCPLYQDSYAVFYFDTWASVVSPLTIEVKNE